MEARKAADWLQIVGNLGLILGLAAVVYELNQNSVHTRAQMLMDDYINIQQRYYTVMGDDPATTIAKAKSTLDLTEEDKVILDAYLLSKYLQLESYEYIARYGVYEGAAEGDVKAMLSQDWNFPYAQVWWQRERDRIYRWEGEKLPGYIDRMFARD